jgi:hypothetical protein
MGALNAQAKTEAFRSLEEAFHRLDLHGFAANLDRIVTVLLDSTGVQHTNSSSAPEIPST